MRYLHKIFKTLSETGGMGGLGLILKSESCKRGNYAAIVKACAQ